MDLILIPFFISSFLFIYSIYNKAQNLRLNNLKFTFVFFHLLSSTFKIFVPIVSIYLISVGDAVYIYITRMMLPIEESGNIFKLFIRAATLSDVG